MREMRILSSWTRSRALHLESSLSRRLTRSCVWLSPPILVGIGTGWAILLETVLTVFQ